MSFGTAFYLFVLPVAIAVCGVMIGYYARHHNHHVHPGE
jgi:hypothetical protein